MIIGRAGGGLALVHRLQRASAQAALQAPSMLQRLAAQLPRPSRRCCRPLSASISSAIGNGVADVGFDIAGQVWRIWRSSGLFFPDRVGAGLDENDSRRARADWAGQGAARRFSMSQAARSAGFFTLRTFIVRDPQRGTALLVFTSAGSHRYAFNAASCGRVGRPFSRTRPR